MLFYLRLKRFCVWLFHQVALWTLGQQVASTGYVVEPYRKYPSLLEVLLNFLKTEQNQGIRREVCTGASAFIFLTVVYIEMWDERRWSQWLSMRPETLPVSVYQTNKDLLRSTDIDQ